MKAILTILLLYYIVSIFAEENVCINSPNYTYGLSSVPNPICVSSLSGFDPDLVSFQRLDDYYGAIGSSTSYIYGTTYSSWNTILTNACAKLKSRKNRVITDITFHINGDNVSLKGSVIELLKEKK